MTWVYGLVSLIPALCAWVAFAWSFNHLRRREWANGLGMAVVGLILSGVALGLIARAVGL
jgi:hypothetical protein